MPVLLDVKAWSDNGAKDPCCWAPAAAAAADLFGAGLLVPGLPPLLEREGPLAASLLVLLVLVLVLVIFVIIVALPGS